MDIFYCCKIKMWINYNGGDETRGNSSYWTNPYDYFKVTKNELKKYTGNNNIKYQVYTNRWLPDVNVGSGEYAGILGNNINRVYIDNLTYRVKSGSIWLPEVVGRDDYAGYSSLRAITDIAIKNAVIVFMSKEMVG